MALRCAALSVSCAAGGAPGGARAKAGGRAAAAPAKRVGTTLPPALQKAGGGTVKRKPVAPKTKAPPSRSKPAVPWWLSDDVPAELKPLQTTIAGFLSPLTTFLREQQRARAKSALAAAIEGTQRGLLPGAGGRAAVEAAVDELASVAELAAASGIPTPPSAISATWRLTWTSERETLFLLRYGIPFVGAAGESYQVIDTAKGTLANVIEFGDKGAAFVVDSRISGDSMPKRVDFSFSAAELRLAPPNKPLQLPPFGQGYFENLYVDDTLRVARDSRGDTLVVERAAPWKG